MKKTTLSILIILSAVFILNSCNKFDFFNHHGGPTPKNYDASVAVGWAKLQLQLSKTTAGFDPAVTGRSFAYSGLALYESVQPGMPGYQSLASQLSAGLALPQAENKSYYWPAAANKAMADVIRNLFSNTTPANISSIDSLEADFNNKFTGEASSAELQRSIDFGNKVATAVFEYSKTDGMHEGWKGPFSPSYAPPIGPGLWIPTPSGFTPPARPFMGDNRPFIPGIAAKATAPAPLAYSDEPGSPFYKIVDYVYTLSLSLTAADTVTVRFWADLPGQFNGPAHFTSVLTQLIQAEKFNLGEAAVAYAKHGIALNDAGIACFKTKYQYNLIRPVSYIRSVLVHPNWNPVINTPPHPEYTSAHATIMQATAEVLKDIFGKNHHFTDRSFETTYGARSYKNFDEYAWDGAWSRVIGGIHYLPSAYAGIEQGKKAGAEVNKLRFKGND
jgi:hypothetical protein